MSGYSTAGGGIIPREVRNVVFMGLWRDFCKDMKSNGPVLTLEGIACAVRSASFVMTHLGCAENAFTLQ